MKLAKILMMLAFFSYPYYIFPSGGFQPSVGVILCIFVSLLFITPKPFTFSVNMRILVIYTVYAGLVNTYWYFQTDDGTLLLHLTITMFGTFMFITLGSVFNNFTRSDAKMFLAAIFVTMATQAALLTLGIVKDVGGGRQIIWFNNPNQLGYFCVLAATIAVILSYYYKIKSFFVPLIIAIGIYLTAFTLSRASLGALVLFIPILLLFSNTLSLIKKVAIIMVLGVGFIFAADLYLQSDTYAALERRVERSQSAVSQTNAEVRHYDRIWKHPENLAFGAGKGGYARYSEGEEKAQEIHNLFLSVLFSYGVVGLLLYMIFWFKAIPNFQVLIYMGPVIVYNMTHNGGRVIAFWFVLALIASASDRKLRKIRRR
jgi:hypothetical protein